MSDADSGSTKSAMTSVVGRPVRTTSLDHRTDTMNPGLVREPVSAADEPISLFAIGAMLLRNRWRIARWTVIGGAIAAALVLNRPALYKASASFIPQSSDAGRSGLASLASQFGVAIPVANQSQSPDFYNQLLTSRVVLSQVARDTITVPELGGRRMALLDVFNIDAETPKRREEIAVKRLRRIVKPMVSRNSGSVEVSVMTEWPSVSLAIVSSLVDGVNQFNQRARQSQAAVERKFVESRMAVASEDLRAAEDRLTAFLRANRQFEGSPQLVFERERLQRDVYLRQETFTTLTQAYEDVRIREVRDTPVITVLEPPAVPSVPEPRGRVVAVILGLLIGGLLGMLLALVSEMFLRRRRAGNPEADELVAVISDMKAEMLGRARRLRSRVSP
jgi:uncharacterized protein involved in exopolysaccharide biosynthesis